MSCPITLAELRVLVAMSDGKPAKIAAHELGLSEQTVKNQLSSVYRKLGVRGLVQAYARLGWLLQTSVSWTSGPVDSFNVEAWQPDPLTWTTS